MDSSTTPASAGIIGAINAQGGSITGAARLIEVDPWKIAFSPTNPRKRKGLDVDSLRTLADSLAKTGGPLQPPLARPLPGSRVEDTYRNREEGRPPAEYELVCGERRVRGSILAELPTIRILVQDLTDEAALELQLVENIEREDLDPIEEAEGFQLLQQKLGYSAEKIAERIGRGRGKDYVIKTMKLLALTPESREALYAGDLGRSTALIVARYPAEKQAEVVGFIKSMAGSGEPAPFRIVAPAVHRRFALQMKRAVWDLEDASLVPTAGACATCPKRTGAHCDLFGDAGTSEDSCTDADCFDGKRSAHMERVKAQAAKDGFKVIDGEEAKKITSPHSDHIDGYTPVTATAYTTKGDDGKERAVTFEDALRGMGKKAPKPRIVINPHTGAAVKVISDNLADTLAPASGDEGNDSADRAGGAARQPLEDTRTPEERAMAQHDVRRAVFIRVFDAVRNRDRTDADLLLVAKALLLSTIPEANLGWFEQYHHWDTDLADNSGAELTQLINDKLDAMPAADVAAAVTMAAVEVLASHWTTSMAAQVALAQQYGVDVLAVRDKVADDLAQREEAAQADQEDAQEAADAYAEAMGGARPPAGARVRIKEDLRGPNGKLRKICGREGVLVSVHDGCWMFKADNGKDKAAVERHEFDVLQLPEEGGDAAGVNDADDADDAAAAAAAHAAAWPFSPKERH